MGGLICFAGGSSIHHLASKRDGGITTIQSPVLPKQMPLLQAKEWYLYAVQ